MEDIVKNEFLFYAKLAKPLVLNLPKSRDRILSAAWIRKFSDENTGDEKLRTMYLKLLLFCLQRRRLSGIFADDPASYEILEELPPDIDLNEFARNLLEQEREDHREMIRQEMMGDMVAFPAFTTDCSSDLTEYVAAQDIPNFGVHAYYAISKQPVNKWQRSELAILPKGTKSAIETSIGPVAAPGTPKTTASAPEVEEGTDVPKLSDPTPEKKKRRPKKLGTSPPTHPIGEVQRAAEDRLTPTWGTNLVDVRERTDIGKIEEASEAAKALDSEVSRMLEEEEAEEEQEQMAARRAGDYESVAAKAKDMVHIIDEFKHGKMDKSKKKPPSRLAKLGDRTGIKAPKSTKAPKIEVKGMKKKGKGRSGIGPRPADLPEEFADWTEKDLEEAGLTWQDLMPQEENIDEELQQIEDEVMGGGAEEQLVIEQIHLEGYEEIDYDALIREAEADLAANATVYDEGVEEDEPVVELFGDEIEDLDEQLDISREAQEIRTTSPAISRGIPVTTPHRASSPKRVKSPEKVYAEENDFLLAHRPSPLRPPKIPKSQIPMGRKPKKPKEPTDKDPNISKVFERAQKAAKAASECLESLHDTAEFEKLERELQEQAGEARKSPKPPPSPGMEAQMAAVRQRADQQRQMLRSPERMPSPHRHHMRATERTPSPPPPTRPQGSGYGPQVGGADPNLSGPPCIPCGPPEFTELDEFEMYEELYRQQSPEGHIPQFDFGPTDVGYIDPFAQERPPQPDAEHQRKTIEKKARMQEASLRRGSPQANEIIGEAELSFDIFQHSGAMEDQLFDETPPEFAGSDSAQSSSLQPGSPLAHQGKSSGVCPAKSHGVQQGQLLQDELPPEFPQSPPPLQRFSPQMGPMSTYDAGAPGIFLDDIEPPAFPSSPPCAPPQGPISPRDLGFSGRAEYLDDVQQPDFSAICPSPYGSPQQIREQGAPPLEFPPTPPSYYQGTLDRTHKPRRKDRQRHLKPTRLFEDEPQSPCDTCAPKPPPPEPCGPCDEEPSKKPKRKKSKRKHALQERRELEEFEELERDMGAGPCARPPLPYLPGSPGEAQRVRERAQRQYELLSQTSPSESLPKSKKWKGKHPPQERGELEKFEELERAMGAGPCAGPPLPYLPASPGESQRVQERAQRQYDLLSQTSPSESLPKRRKWKGKHPPQEHEELEEFEELEKEMGAGPCARPPLPQFPAASGEARRVRERAQRQYEVLGQMSPSTPEGVPGPSRRPTGITPPQYDSDFSPPPTPQPKEQRFPRARRRVFGPPPPPKPEVPQPCPGAARVQSPPKPPRAPSPQRTQQEPLQMYPPERFDYNYLPDFTSYPEMTMIGDETPPGGFLSTSWEKTPKDDFLDYETPPREFAFGSPCLGTEASFTDMLEVESPPPGFPSPPPQTLRDDQMYFPPEGLPSRTPERLPTMAELKEHRFVPDIYHQRISHRTPFGRGPGPDHWRESSQAFSQMPQIPEQEGSPCGTCGSKKPKRFQMPPKRFGSPRPQLPDLTSDQERFHQIIKHNLDIPQDQYPPQERIPSPLSSRAASPQRAPCPRSTSPQATASTSGIPKAARRGIPVPKSQSGKRPQLREKPKEDGQGKRGEAEQSRAAAAPCAVPLPGGRMRPPDYRQAGGSGEVVAKSVEKAAGLTVVQGVSSLRRILFEAPDVTRRPRHRAEGSELAQELQQHQIQFPGYPNYIVSGGRRRKLTRHSRGQFEGFEHHPIEEHEEATSPHVRGRRQHPYYTDITEGEGAASPYYPGLDDGQQEVCAPCGPQFPPEPQEEPERSPYYPELPDEMRRSRRRRRRERPNYPDITQEEGGETPYYPVLDDGQQEVCGPCGPQFPPEPEKEPQRSPYYPDVTQGEGGESPYYPGLDDGQQEIYQPWEPEFPPEPEEEPEQSPYYPELPDVMRRSRPPSTPPFQRAPCPPRGSPEELEEFERLEGEMEHEEMSRFPPEYQAQVGELRQRSRRELEELSRQIPIPSVQKELEKLERDILKEDERKKWKERSRKYQDLEDAQEAERVQMEMSKPHSPRIIHSPKTPPGAVYSPGFVGQRGTCGEVEDDLFTQGASHGEMIEDQDFHEALAGYQSPEQLSPRIVEGYGPQIYDYQDPQWLENIAYEAELLAGSPQMLDQETLEGHYCPMSPQRFPQTGVDQHVFRSPEMLDQQVLQGYDSPCSSPQMSHLRDDSAFGMQFPRLPEMLDRQTLEGYESPRSPQLGDHLWDEVGFEEQFLQSPEMLDQQQPQLYDSPCTPPAQRAEREQRHRAREQARIEAFYQAERQEIRNMFGPPSSPESPGPDFRFRVGVAYHEVPQAFREGARRECRIRDQIGPDEYNVVLPRSAPAPQLETIQEPRPRTPQAPRSGRESARSRRVEAPCPGPSQTLGEFWRGETARPASESVQMTGEEGRRRAQERLRQKRQGSPSQRASCPASRGPPESPRTTQQSSSRAGTAPCAGPSQSLGEFWRGESPRPAPASRMQMTADEGRRRAQERLRQRPNQQGGCPAARRLEASASSTPRSQQSLSRIAERTPPSEVELVPLDEFLRGGPAPGADPESGQQSTARRLVRKTSSYKKIVTRQNR